MNIDLSVIMNTEISSKYIELNKLENFNESFNDDLKDLSNFDFSYQSQYLKKVRRQKHKITTLGSQTTSTR